MNKKNKVCKCIKLQFTVLQLLPKNDCLQYAEYYVRGCTWQLKKVKTIYRFYKLVLDKGESSLECFNVWAVAADSSQISYEGK